MENNWKLLLWPPASCIRSSHLRRGPRQAYLQSHSFLQLRQRHNDDTKTIKDATCRNMSNPQAASFQRILAMKLLTCNTPKKKTHAATHHTWAEIPCDTCIWLQDFPLDRPSCLQLCCRFLKLRDHRLCRFVQKFCHPQHWNQRVMGCPSNEDENIWEPQVTRVNHVINECITPGWLLCHPLSLALGVGSRLVWRMRPSLKAHNDSQSTHPLPKSPQSLCINPFLEEL